MLPAITHYICLYIHQYGFCVTLQNEAAFSKNSTPGQMKIKPEIKTIQHPNLTAPAFYSKTINYQFASLALCGTNRAGSNSECLTLSTTSHKTNGSFRSHQVKQKS